MLSTRVLTSHVQLNLAKKTALGRWWALDVMSDTTYLIYYRCYRSLVKARLHELGELCHSSWEPFFFVVVSIRWVLGVQINPLTSLPPCKLIDQLNLKKEEKERRRKPQHFVKTTKFQLVSCQNHLKHETRSLPRLTQRLCLHQECFTSTGIPVCYVGKGLLV